MTASNMNADPERPKARGANPLIKIEAVEKSYPNGVSALRGVDAVAYEGEVVCVIGPSGSGKSTLLRCVNGLERFEGGRIVFDGSEVSHRGAATREIRRHIGMVFQNFELFPHMNALANVAEGPRTVLRMAREAAYARARALLAKVGLADKETALPAQLSGGQQQRVAIARALAMEPRAMLFDEVTSALDPETVNEVLVVMQQLAQEGMTMLVVTHEMSFARSVADWIVVMEAGRLLEEGPPAVIFDNPRSARTREFLRHIAPHAPGAS